MAPDTYREILARNIRAARSRIGIGQEDLAVRMRALGYQAWIRQTVGATERARRRPTAEEVLGLAACLGTSVQSLMSPLLQDGPVELPSGVPLAVGQVRSLVFGLESLEDNPRSSVRGARDLRGVWWQGNSPVWEGAEHAVNRPIPVEDELPVDDLAVRPIPAEEGKDRPIVAAIVTSDRGMLVSHRRDGKPPWGFITGEIEPDESPKDAAQREVKEETGLEVRAGRVIGERNPHPQTGKHMIYMAATPTEGSDVFVGDEAELDRVEWVSLADADELMPTMFGPVHEYLERELGED